MPPEPGPATPLVAPLVFARVRPLATSGGHSDTGQIVFKRLKSFMSEDGYEYSYSAAGVSAAAAGSGDADSNAGGGKARVTLEDAHGEAHYDWPREVFGPDVSQDELYEKVAKPQVAKFTQRNGHNVLAFAYGQTGTGKTHTIMGPQESWGTVRHPEWGLFPRVVDAALAEMKSRDSSTAFAMHISAVEFYFCGAFDLLDGHKQCVIVNHEPVGHQQTEVSSPEDVLGVLDAVRTNRTTAATRMNRASHEHGGSSRSHCALICTLRQLHKASGEVCSTSFTCVDLAGAERPSSNGDEHTSAMAAFMQYYRDPLSVSPASQGSIINMELSGLRSAAVTATEAHRRGRKVSAPTQLGTAAVDFLSSAFDGRALLSMVVTLSPAPGSGWETWFACTYGEDLAKLRCPVRPVKPVNVAKLAAAAAAAAGAAEAALAKTPASGHPSSKYYARRVVEARHFAQETRLVAQLVARGSGRSPETRSI